MYEILINLAKNNKTSELDFYNKKLKRSQIHEISQILKTNTSIKSLNLGSNNLIDKDIIILCKGLKNNKNLTELLLKGNRITKRGGYAIAKILINSNIQILDLSWNNIKDMGILTILNSIKNNQNVTEANISWNNLKNKRKIKERLTNYLRYNNEQKRI